MIHGRLCPMTRQTMSFYVGRMTHCDDLGRSVVRTSTASLEHPLSRFPRSHPEIRYFDVLVLVKQQVLRLQIAMTDVEPMAIVDGMDDLLKVV